MHRIVFFLKRAHFSVRKVMDEALADYGLTTSQMEVLGVIALSGQIEHRMLLECIEIASPTLTSLVDNLVKRGFIERTISHEDARVKLLAPTSEGKELWQRLEANEGSFFDTLLAGFSPAEVALLQEFLQRLIANACGGECGPLP